MKPKELTLRGLILGALITIAVATLGGGLAARRFGPGKPAPDPTTTAT